MPQVLCRAKEKEKSAGAAPEDPVEKYIKRLFRLADVFDGLAHIGRALHHDYASGGERRHLLGGRAFAAGNDCAGVPHSAAWRRGLAGDEADDRLLELPADEARRLLLRRPADLADHDHGFGVLVGCEQPEGIDERGANERIAANPNARRLAEAEASELMDGFIGERAAFGDDP